MTASVAAWSEAYNATGGSLEPSEPTGTVEGSALLAVQINNMNTTPALNTGWNNLTAISESTLSYRLSYIIRGASAPDLSFGAAQTSNPARVVLIRLADADTLDLINVSALFGDDNTGNNNTDCPSVTTDADDCLILRLAFNRSKSMTFASSTAEIDANSGGGAIVGVASGVKATAGVVAVENVVTNDSSNGVLHTATIGINAAASGPDGTGGRDGDYDWTDLDGTGDYQDYSFTLDYDADLKVYEYHPTNTDGATEARHRLYVDDVLIATAYVDQTANGETDNLIFEESVSAGVVKVRIDDFVGTSTGTYVYSDSITFDPIPSIAAPVANDAEVTQYIDADDTFILIDLVSNATYEGAGAITVDSIVSAPSGITGDTAVLTDSNGVEQAPYTHAKYDNPNRTAGESSFTYQLIADGQLSNIATRVITATTLVPQITVNDADYDGDPLLYIQPERQTGFYIEG